MDIEKRARELVDKKKEFRKSVTSFISTGLIFLVLIFFLPHMSRWLFFGLAIWGITLVGQGIKLYRYNSDDADWEEREYRKEVARLRELESSRNEEYNLNDLSTAPKQKVTNSEKWNDDELV